MLRIVLDTNVIISAALSPTGMCAKIFDSIARSKEIQFFYNADILIEYQEVLSRKHLNIDPNKQAVYLGEIKKMGMEVVPTTSTISMPDESDRIFYDTAREIGAVLVTGNQKHYPAVDFIMSPAEFLQLLDKPITS